MPHIAFSKESIPYQKLCARLYIFLESQFVYTVSGTMTEIKFGTDGWRAVIAEDFTYANVRKVALAIARYVIRAENAQQRGVLIGYDNRFYAPEFARVAAEVISST